MREGQIKFAHYYEYLSGSIILRLGDGFLRIAIFVLKDGIRQSSTSFEIYCST